MTKYLVAITEIVEYLVPVTAANEDQAAERGMNKLIRTRNRDQWSTDVTARDVDGVNIDEPLARSSSRKMQRGALRHSADL